MKRADYKFEWPVRNGVEHFCWATCIHCDESKSSPVDVLSIVNDRIVELDTALGIKHHPDCAFFKAVNSAVPA